MSVTRRGFLSLLGTLPMLGPARAAVAAANAIEPRHVLCFLCGDAKAHARLVAGLSTAIAAGARGFEIDETYSLTEADPRMADSFAVCRDRVAPNAWSADDERAVANHGSVVYVLGPRMAADSAVATSATALTLVDSAIAAGAVAVKGESAGVAHGIVRWRRLIAQAAAASALRDVHALREACRLAFAKRPLRGEEYLESVGFHLVGLPEVYVGNGYPSERAATAFMDVVANELSREPIARVLEKHGGRLTFESAYAQDDFKYNPYGCVQIDGA